MNNVERLIASILMACAVASVVYLAVTPDSVGFYLWDALQNIPFYTLNAWGCWLAVLNTVILLIGLGYMRRKMQDVTVFVFAVKGVEQGQDLTVTQDQPVLKMEDYAHA